jgi:hypothetical protein
MGRKGKGNVPVRGLIVVLLIISAAATGWYFFVHRDGLQLNGATVSKDITPASPGPNVQTGPVVPTFVTARVGASGEAVLTGRGAPGSVVTIVLAGQVIGTTNVSPRSDWTIVLDQPLSIGSQQLTLRAEHDGNTIASDDAVIVHTTVAGTVPLVLDVRFGGASRYLQRPDDLPPVDLSLNAVDYDSSGGMVLSGHAGAGSTVRLYLDNQPLGDTVTDADGHWSLRPANVAAGAYTLRIDQLGLKSIVVQRIEEPLERGDASAVARALLGDAMLTVQPGENLWRIARQVPDKGYQYTVLYRATQDQTRDPNLTYPGQVFEPVEAPKPQ